VNALRRAARLVTATGLGVDAYVHWHLAPGYDAIVGHGSPHLSQGQLFRVEAAGALIGLLLVLLVPARWAAAVAVVIAAVGVMAVLGYRYVDLGAFGPVPNMYEPFWYTEKTVSLLAEAAAVIGGAVCLRLTRPSSRPGRSAPLGRDRSPGSG
jgi:hypothetical protein